MIAAKDVESGHVIQHDGEEFGILATIGGDGKIYLVGIGKKRLEGNDRIVTVLVCDPDKQFGVAEKDECVMEIITC